MGNRKASSCLFNRPLCFTPCACTMLKQWKGWEKQHKTHVLVQKILGHVVGLSIHSSRVLVTDLSSLAFALQKLSTYLAAVCCRGSSASLGELSLREIVCYNWFSFWGIPDNFWGTSGVLETQFKIVSVVTVGVLFSSTAIPKLCTERNKYMK